MNFTKRPMKNPAAKRIIEFEKLFFRLFIEKRSFFKVLYAILCKKVFFGYKTGIFTFVFE